MNINKGYWSVVVSLVMSFSGFCNTDLIDVFFSIFLDAIVKDLLLILL